MPHDTAPPAVRIAVVGDFRPDHDHHPPTTASIGHAADHRGRDGEGIWVSTTAVAGRADAELAGFDGVWIAPGSPYASMQGALDAITFARTTGVPLLGTCAGFQHIVIEVGRNVCGIRDATHAESEPDAPVLMITPLECSLAGLTFAVRFAEGSVAAHAYGTDQAEERYYCSFGLNPDFVDVLADAGLAVTGTDHEGEARIVELASYDQFLVGTLFVPQMRSEPGRPHPLVLAFVDAAIRRADARAGSGASPGVTR
jgi:CTP synthase (UTP-ammonia lyase)